MVATLRWLRWVAKWHWDIERVPVYNNPNGIASEAPDFSTAELVAAELRGDSAPAARPDGDVPTANYGRTCAAARTGVMFHPVASGAFGNLSTRQVHPDAALQDPRSFDPQDIADEQTLLRQLWMLLRMGDLESSFQLCKERGRRLGLPAKFFHSGLWELHARQLRGVR